SDGTVEIDDPFVFDGTLSFTASDAVLILPGTIDVTSVSIVSSDTMQLVQGGGGTIDLHIDPSQSLTTGNLALSNGTITISCFRAGTRIAAAGGQVAVETLRVGDHVVTVAGGVERLRPIRWVGHRRIDCRLHPSPRQVWPVRV